jgi:hypothetical protein
MGCETYHNLCYISCDNSLAIGQACLLTVRRGRRFGDVASIGLPITNHFSPITLRRANACSGQASHLPVRHSPTAAWPPPDDVGSRRASGPAGALLGSVLYTFLRHRSWPICGTGRLWGCEPLGPDKRQLAVAFTSSRFTESSRTSPVCLVLFEFFRSMPFLPTLAGPILRCPSI